MLRRTLLALALAFTMTVLIPAQAHACSCAITTLRDQVVATDRIFIAVVRSVRKVSEHELAVRMRVRRVFKGRVFQSSRVFTATNGAMCGVRSVPGRRYVVFADRTSVGMSMNSCGGTQVYTDSYRAQVRAITGPSYAPVPNP